MTDSPNTCGAKTKGTGEPCGRPAGWGTDHAGSGKCKLHGGASPIKHGLYSKHASRRLSGRLAEMREAGGELSDLAEDIALARAIISTQLERTDALNSDQADTIMELIERLSRIIARHDKIQHGERYTVTFDEVGQFTEAVKASVRRHFDQCNTAEDLIAKIGEALEDKVSR